MTEHDRGGTLPDQPKRFADTAQSGNILNRHFCGNCGSPLYSQREEVPWTPIDPATERHPQNRPIKSWRA